MSKNNQKESNSTLNLLSTLKLKKELCIYNFAPSEEKEMATHSSVLAWRIPGTEEPGGLLSMGSPRVRHD